ncbi:phage tail protein [Marivivens niveibacter]|uniref:Phage tail protein n=1 Tax=Marivivens niveibacter TaxID=1930667 RepID=A0A251X2A0_9RHOB|nr:phage tail tape measure protein [Marivivens niveibacter]OUD10701.1 phage tail protein [Marivivens niveibacter]
MADIEQLDDLENGLDAIEKSLSDTTSMASAFEAQLRLTRSTLSDTARDLGKLETGFSSGLRKAFDGLAFNGMKLSDALTSLAQSMSNTVYNAAMKPVTDQLGTLMADGLNALVSGSVPFANGGAFSQGRVMPFAKGGVVSSPVTFPMRGATGLMGEAGPEAIMPLTRGSDGRLGVAAQGGGNVNVTMNISTPNVEGFQKSQTQIAAQLSRAMGRANRNR